MVSLVTVGGAIGVLLECGVWAHYGHTEWPDPHQLWGKLRRGGLDIRRVLMPLLRKGAELAPPINRRWQAELSNGRYSMSERMGLCRGGGKIEL